MRRIFQHKFLLYFLACSTLAIAIADFSEPLIEDYNRNVSAEQQKLKTAANGVDNRKSMFSPTDCFPRSQAITFISLMLFISLIFSKRIVFSFLFIFLYIVQHILANYIILSLRKDGYFFPNDDAVYYDMALLTLSVSLSFWLAYRVEKRINPDK